MDAQPAVATPSSEAQRAWPHTKRLLPWSVAGFLAMLWLVPFNAVIVPVPLPVDSVLDRVVLPILAAFWIASLCAARRSGGLRYRPTGIDFFLGALFVIAIWSVVHNVETLTALGEFDLAVKKIAILGSFGLVFYIVATVVRPSELDRWALSFVLLATVMATGVIWEYRTGTNVFYNWTDTILPNSVSVLPEKVDPMFGRELVSGPTDTPIVTGMMLAMGLAFALTGLMRAQTTRRKLLYTAAVTLILAGCFSTIRKTGLVAPVAAMLTLLVYRPRQMVRLLPFGLVVVLLIQGLAPGAIVRVRAQFVGGGGFWKQKSVEGRTEDYGPIKPDIRKNLRWGRGHGTYDPAKYRFLDNEYIGRIVETGVPGLVIYLLLILAVIRVAHRASRSRDPARASMGAAVVACAVVYMVSNLVFDALSFPQAPYMFLFVAGLAVVAASDSHSDTGGRLRARFATPVASPTMREGTTT
jgi:O-antigen ligase